ncbi:hypothetical protein L210DRAFT_3546656 [Boletus edulis BED1]|uniref:Secreted protein n=1 Tax=Boletus edulis BED1 TaxID=1328754 RepID=A0AAD4GD03_BOLED|nr:hypothetical protein L210DRAFT_3546656 [Boletus edulis BED1]
MIHLCASNTTLRWLRWSSPLFLPSLLTPTATAAEESRLNMALSMDGPRKVPGIEQCAIIGTAEREQVESQELAFQKFASWQFETETPRPTTKTPETVRDRMERVDVGN